MAGVVFNTLLSAESAVTDIVGDRIFPDMAPQGVKGDYVVFQEVTTTPTDTKGSVSRLDEERWQVDGYCKDDETRDNLQAAIRLALDYKSGSIAGHNIDRIRFLNKNGGFDDGGEKFRTSQDFKLRKHRG